VYHGHDGGVAGGLTEMAYMPDNDVGYFYSINAANGGSFGKIGETIRAYITRNLAKPVPPPVARLSTNAAAYAGWYQPDSTRSELTHFLERLLGLVRIRFDDGKLLLSNIGERNIIFVPVTDTQFRSDRKKGPPSPIATVELLTSNAEGQFIQLGAGEQTIKRIPTWFAIFEIILTCWFVLAVVLVLLYAPFWILGGLSKERRRPAERGMRVWPLIAVLSLIAVVIIFSIASDDLIPRMGNLTVWSASFFLATVVYALATLAGAVSLWRAPKEGVRTGVRRFSTVVILALLVAAAYFAYWGIIGLRTWG